MSDPLSLEDKKLIVFFLKEKLDKNEINTVELFVFIQLAKELMGAGVKYIDEVKLAFPYT